MDKLATKREVFHTNIRTSKRVLALKQHRHQVMQTLARDNLTRLVLQLPSSINEVHQKIIDNDQAILVVIRDQFKEVIRRLACANYKEWTFLVLVCDHLVLTFQESQVTSIGFNWLVQSGRRLARNDYQEEITSRILNTTFLNLKHIEYFSAKSMQYILQAINRVMSTSDTSRPGHSFMYSLNIIYRGLELLIYDQQKLCPEHQDKLLNMLKEILVNNPKSITTLLFHSMQDVTSNTQYILEILINSTYILPPEQLKEILPKLPLQMAIFNCLQETQSNVSMKTISLIRNILTIDPTFDRMSVNSNILPILLGLLTSHPALQSEIIDTLVIYLMDLGKKQTIDYFCEIQGIYVLVNVLNDNYPRIDDNPLTQLVMLIKFLVDQQNQMDTCHETFFRILQDIQDCTNSSELDKVCQSVIMDYKQRKNKSSQ